jgi:Ca2+-binding RTX toxin-like protein
MKKAILILVVALAILPAAFSRAETGPVTLLISGDRNESTIFVSLSPDGREYEVFSSAPLEVGGSICSHPEEMPYELLCKATAIAGFEVNAGGGGDNVTFTSDIPVPVTIRGGPGTDQLTGGGASDKIIGGPDIDYLFGRRGDDWILGGSGTDRLVGGPGDDQLVGGPDKDKINGGPGENGVIP